jgi:hypothetical protein
MATPVGSDNILRISSFGDTSGRRGGVWTKDFKMTPESKAKYLEKQAIWNRRTMSYNNVISIVRNRALSRRGLEIQRIKQRGTDAEKESARREELEFEVVQDYHDFFSIDAWINFKDIDLDARRRCPLDDCSEALFQLGALLDKKYGPYNPAVRNRMPNVRYIDPVRFRRDIIKSGPSNNASATSVITKPASNGLAKPKGISKTSNKPLARPKK